MPNIPPLITATPEAQSIYLERARNSGVAANLTWGAGSGAYAGTYVATATVPRVFANSVVVASVQGLAVADIAIRLIAAVPTTNTITFVATAAPSVTASFKIGYFILEQQP